MHSSLNTDSVFYNVSNENKRVTESTIAQQKNKPRYIIIHQLCVWLFSTKKRVNNFVCLASQMGGNSLDPKIWSPRVSLTQTGSSLVHDSSSSDLWRIPWPDFGSSCSTRQATSSWALSRSAPSRHLVRLETDHRQSQQTRRPWWRIWRAGWTLRRDGAGRSAKVSFWLVILRYGWLLLIDYHR